MTWMIVGVRIEPMKKEDWELFLSNGPKMTTSENKRYLRNLLPRYQLTHGSYQLLFVHGSPRRINEYLFPDRPDENLVHTMMNESANVLICGHTHRPFSRKVQDVWFINDGSVGRPKDGDWRAGWVLLTILDNHALQIELRSVNTISKFSKLPMQIPSSQPNIILIFTK